VLVGIMAGIVGLSIGSESPGDIAKQEADLLWSPGSIGRPGLD